MAPVNTVKIIGVSFISTKWNPKYCRNSVKNRFCFCCIDSDCGRGFKRIGSICVNVSSEAVASSEIQAKCAELGASPLTITSSEMFYQLRVCINTSYVFKRSLFFFVNIIYFLRPIPETC